MYLIPLTLNSLDDPPDEIAKAAAAVATEGNSKYVETVF